MTQTQMPIGTPPAAPVPAPAAAPDAAPATTAAPPATAAPATTEPETAAQPAAPAAMPPLPIIDPPPPPTRPAETSTTVSGSEHPNAPPPEQPKAAAPAGGTNGAEPAAGAPRANISDLPFIPENATQAYRIARMLVGSKLLPPGVTSEADIAYLLMWGQQWKLPPIACLQVHIIKGKPCLPAAHIVGIIKASLLCFEFDCIDSTMRSSTWVARRIGRDGMPGREIKLEYTIEEAEMMGLLSKGRSEESAGRNQWNTQPKVMLRWRAATALARLVFPDLLLGLHSTEEMIDALDISGPEVQLVQITRDELEKARRQTPIEILRPALPAGQANDFDGLDRAMAERQNQPEPLPAQRGDQRQGRGGLNSRVAERAAQTQQGPLLCPSCGGLVRTRGMCDACKNQ